jgi:hypothetical protein
VVNCKGCLMNKRLILSFIIAFGLIPFFGIPAYANSSWHWLTDNRPIYILPFVIIGTLVIETVIICLVNRTPTVKKMAFVFLIVCLANLVSFLLPYLFRFSPIIFMTRQESFQYKMESFPAYVVGIGFLLLTIASEIPIVYFSLQRKVKSKIRLIVSIISANIVTTGLVAILERIYSPGSW